MAQSQARTSNPPHGVGSKNWLHPERPVLSGVHFWWTRVDPAEVSELAIQSLTNAEMSRAGRFHFRADRVRFLARRTFLRKVLSRYLGSPAGQLVFRTSPFGKPELDPACGIYFNTSHSDELAVVGVAGQPEVGIDIERIRPIPDMEDLADRFFSPQEVAQLRSATGAGRLAMFFILWTRKEAYIKARGAGFSIPLNTFDVSTSDGSETGLVRGWNDEAPFSFANLPIPVGFIGAVTLAGKQISVVDMTAEGFDP